MDVKGRRGLLWGTLLALLAVGIGVALRPQPVPVDLAIAEVAPLRVTVDEEGMTRVREVFTLDAPVAGRLRRIDVDAGDPVEADRTVLATIDTAPPALLDARRLAEQRAALEAARSTRDLAAAERERAAADLAFARRELDRARRLAEEQSLARRALEDAERAFRVASAELTRSEAALAVREHELERAAVQLLSPLELEARQASCECVTVTSPTHGVVLRVLRRSAGIVGAGTPLMEIGDPADLEVVVDLLSEDAVRVSPGQAAILGGWGGPELAARVRRIEPLGVTRVSALGIEEQRVDVVLDLSDPPARWERLGHDYRVDVGIVLFEGEVLQVPLGALFRDGDDWAVFVADDGEARRQTVTIGARNDLAVQIRDGLEAGQRVIRYPGERVSDGSAIVER
ncbi:MULTISPECIES: efflux RND transporter periplasmic adaptor subunit [Halomonas]|uniref:Membrane protein n=1 Tax=Halomonas halophila TaxID=29573 RepID=A0ABQ0U2M7_9GAMM|nr:MULTISPECIES: HlyD family efflux transporter periplasmic adaptor subunit [Halomonas]MDR5890139.1 HlyD family efflux transporter periplasmic adaptor subunit [Halomonas salina]RAH37925.1 efflux transporter periplasmic adaptor subunit [Halomonas sp. SL1]WJY06601.1 HlyD family efflux transporter periplasmic adaptor subunit [Halomonas halophila]GEK72788.1 membrane protein [Halomonas halophila]